MTTQRLYQFHQMSEAQIAKIGQDRLETLDRLWQMGLISVTGGQPLYKAKAIDISFSGSVWLFSGDIWWYIVNTDVDQPVKALPGDAWIVENGEKFHLIESMPVSREFVINPLVALEPEACQTVQALYDRADTDGFTLWHQMPEIYPLSSGRFGYPDDSGQTIRRRLYDQTVIEIPDAGSPYLLLDR